MHKFARNFITEWRRLDLPFKNVTVLIAVSGGADSTALVLVLADLKKAKKLDLNFIVAHFNHGLRGAESEADEKFVKDLSKRLEFKFISKIQNSKSKIQNEKGNLEQSARRTRYEFLRQMAEKEDAFAVLTAHTLNDQAETLLLNLIRGSGIEGLGAMRKIRVLGKTRLVRPLLGWAKREDTETFVREREIKFRHDSMNADEKFSRVRIRKNLIPTLREFNPKIVETLAQTAFLLQQESGQLLNVGGQRSENLSVKTLQRLSQTEFYTQLRQWLQAMRGDLRQIKMSNIKAIEQLIFSRKSGRKVELPNGESIIKKDGKIFFEKSKVEKSRSDN